jgi:hypothetical protein
MERRSGSGGRVAAEISGLDASVIGWFTFHNLLNLNQMWIVFTVIFENNVFKKETAPAALA